MHEHEIIMRNDLPSVKKSYLITYAYRNEIGQLLRAYYFDKLAHWAFLVKDIEHINNIEYIQLLDLHKFNCTLEFIQKIILNRLSAENLDKSNLKNL